MPQLNKPTENISKLTDSINTIVELESKVYVENNTLKQDLDIYDQILIKLHDLTHIAGVYQAEIRQRVKVITSHKIKHSAKPTPKLPDVSKDQEEMKALQEPPKKQSKKSSKKSKAAD